MCEVFFFAKYPRCAEEKNGKVSDQVFCISPRGSKEEHS